MDEARIAKLTEEVLREIRGPAPAGELERRVAALERTVGTLGRGAPGTRTDALEVAHRLLDVSAGGDGCVLEPGKPCSASGRCRSFGH